jgi:hypothetical protein
MKTTRLRSDALGTGSRRFESSVAPTKHLLFQWVGAPVVWSGST